MPRTPAASRPIGRTSSSTKRMALPPVVNSRMSLLPSVMATPTSLSPGSSATAIMPRASGIIAVALDPGDKLVGVAITDGSKDILLFTTGGKAIRFVEDEVRPMGREAAGVRGIKLAEEQRVNALIVAEPGYILTASENGFGKLTPLEEFPTHGRGGQGVIAL